MTIAQREADVARVAERAARVRCWAAASHRSPDDGRGGREEMWREMVGAARAAEFETAEAPGSSDLGAEIRAGVRALEGGEL